MNYTETFEQFASKVGPMDLALYAGAGIVLWVLFKEQLSPVQKFFGSLVEKLGELSVPKPKGSNPSVVEAPTEKPLDNNQEDVFFKLIVSWKQTRDLAVKSGCVEAVKVADEMFPFLSPIGCKNIVLHKISLL
jgi:hypothetical protein